MDTERGARNLPGKLTADGTSEDLQALTAFDRCDAPGCTSQAYLRAQLESGLQLVFCGHHGHALTPALVGQGAIIRDDSELLAGDRRLS
jgi:hypothetical protein